MIVVAGILMGLFIGAVVSFLACAYVISEILKEDNHD